MTLAIPLRTEKQEMALCDRIMHTLGYSAIHFAQPRNTMQTPGIADRAYAKGPHWFWLEVKRRGGRQSEYQREFQNLVESAGHEYVIGTSDDLIEYLRRKGIVL